MAPACRVPSPPVLPGPSCSPERVPASSEGAGGTLTAPGEGGRRSSEGPQAAVFILAWCLKVVVFFLSRLPPPASGPSSVKWGPAAFLGDGRKDWRAWPGSGGALDVAVRTRMPGLASGSPSAGVQGHEVPRGRRNAQMGTGDG